MYSLLKTVLHYLTGKSQINRLLTCPRLKEHRNGLVVPSSKLINFISISIQYSKTLSFDIDSEDLIKKIATRKRTTDPKTLKIAIDKIYEVRNLKQKIEDMRIKTFYKSDTADLKVLTGLWKSLKDSEPPEIPSGLWGEIGFQGTDPSTDFRGMGFLGLYQLADFSKQNIKMAKDIFAVASEESNLWFPYAVTGINITAFQYQLLKSQRLDLLLYGSVATVESRYSSIYAIIFNDFLEQWIAAKPRDIMDFPRVFAQVKESYVKSINY